MRRPPLAVPLAIVAWLATALVTRPAPAQDLGRFFEQAARERLRKTVDPQTIGRAIAPKLATAGGRETKAEVVPFQTRDGWTLVTHHYRPTAKAVAGAPPVILCHGLTYNAAFWDLEPSASFAQYLAAQGFDVWSVSLRGCGQSQKWVWSPEDAPEALFGRALYRSTGGKFGTAGNASVDPKFSRWTLDDHILLDVPAVVYHVRRQTGAPQVAWVGHSMGGIVALAHLARFENPGIGRLVTVGSQLTMPQGQVAGRLIRELIQTREGQLAGVIRGAELAAHVKTSTQNLFFNVPNVSPSIYEALTTWAIEVPSIGLMKQYLDLADRGVLLDAGRKFDYAAAVGNVKVPVFLSCGAADSFAPPPVQKFLYDRIGSTDKTLVIFGRAQGYAADMGHDDALVGLNSRTQVYPALARWLAAPPLNPDSGRAPRVATLKHRDKTDSCERAPSRSGIVKGGSESSPPALSAPRVVAMPLKSSRFASNERLQRAANNSPALRAGESGEAVKLLQQTLIDLGFPMPVSTRRSGSPDGIFGSETATRLREFQAKNGLGLDGVAGRDTLNKLDTLLLNKPAPPQPPKPAFDRKVRLHFRSAAMPVVPEFTALDNAQKVYSQINVKLEFVSGLSIGITDEDQLRLDASDGTCHWNQASDEMKLLESLGGRDGVGPTDVVVLYANRIKQNDGSTLNGCAGHEPGRPTVVVAASGSRWTLGHELGHVLLGPSFVPVHATDPKNVMFAPTASIIVDPPGFTPEQAKTIRASKFCVAM